MFQSSSCPNSMPKALYLSILADWNCDISRIWDFLWLTDALYLVSWSLTIFIYSLVFSQRLKEILPKFFIPQIAATPELLNTNSISSARQDPTLQCLVPCTRICKVTPGRRQRCMLSLLCIFSFYPQSQVCFPFSTLK